MRRRQVIALAAPVVAGAVVVAAIWPREPSCNGKCLSAWLEEVISNNSHDRAQAAAALRQMGPRAVPLITTELTWPDEPPWKLKLITLANRQHIVRFHFILANVRRYRALAACDALGPAAREALPTLERMFYTEHQIDAALAMADIGPAAIPSLAKGVTNDWPMIRSYCRAGLALARNTKVSWPNGEEFDFGARQTWFRLKGAPVYDLERGGSAFK
jgi:hypothetical protein